jgi:hypothetical protein
LTVRNIECIKHGVNNNNGVIMAKAWRR